MSEGRRYIDDAITRVGAHTHAHCADWCNYNIGYRHVLSYLTPHAGADELIQTSKDGHRLRLRRLLALEGRRQLF